MVNTDGNGIDFDAFETFQEAVYALHNEHTRCECPICQQIRGKDEVSTLSDGPASAF